MYYQPPGVHLPAQGWKVHVSAAFSPGSAAPATAFLAGQMSGPPVVPPETHRQALRARIQAFIEHNLCDPDLGPTTVAAHHHISVRLLHQLFQGHPETVSATIRRRRLERGRADLTDLRLGHRGIGETAARWGFRHQADFARAFRLAYAMSPSEFRQERRALTVGPPGAHGTGPRARRR
ncbi:helix-turn-helix domain-containing protein [Streptomyces aureocirculatus]|uniref:helix-turn-helix domain-containing protein n=1 Tax=Streptomyces aureocirculatus TaxID=67275 RepID=UPI00068F66D6|nr:helix-turn-helix domain-containing protein [Streptomyces aureocirculatus]